MTIPLHKGNVVVRVGGDLFFLPWSTLKFTSKSEVDLSTLVPMNVKTHSDFNNLQERIIPVKLSEHLTAFDALQAANGQEQALLTVRGQLFQTPISKPPVSPYQIRRFKLAPGSRMGGITRVLWSGYINEEKTLILATNPAYRSSHSWYIGNTSEPSFTLKNPNPFPLLTNMTSVYIETVAFCGNRVAWLDTDKNLHVMDIGDPDSIMHIVLPKVCKLVNISKRSILT